jgi:hypothetical protein
MRSGQLEPLDGVRDELAIVGDLRSSSRRSECPKPGILWFGELTLLAGNSAE